MSVEAQAFWVVAPGRGEIRDERLVPPGAAEALVRTRVSGISRGTESLVFLGHVPASEYQRMRAPFQDGEFPHPVKYGYANVGDVEQGPADLVGRTVFALVPHQTRYVVPAAALRLVPAGVPARRAVLAANLETALNGVWDANVLPGDRVAVVGAGTVGCLAAWLCGRIPGCDVELVDVNEDRAVVAQALGVGFARPQAAARDADVVMHTSGAPGGLVTALELAGFEATVVDLSWYGDATVPLPLGAAFHSRRLTIRSSQVGHVAPRQRARWTFERRMTMALRLLTDAALDVLLTGESPFEELPAVMSTLATESRRTLCHTIRYT